MNVHIEIKNICALVWVVARLVAAAAPRSGSCGRRQNSEFSRLVMVQNKAVRSQRHSVEKVTK